MSTIKVNTLTTLNGSGNITVSRPLAGSGASLTALNATELTSGTIPIARIADDAVTNAKMADAAVTTAVLADGNVATGKIADNAVTSAKIAPLAYETGVDHAANGPHCNTLSSGYSSTIMDLVYLGSGSKWLEADADQTSTSINLLGIALEAKTDNQAMKVALPGSFVRDDSWSWTAGVPLYVGLVNGAITATRPSSVNDVVRVVGYAVTPDIIFFNPSNDYITIA